MLTRTAAIGLGLLTGLIALAQGGGDQQLRTKADALFAEERFAEAMPLYSQLVSLSPRDRDLNYRFGTCLLHTGDDKEKATTYLKFAVQDPSVASLAWYYLGRSYHLTYRFAEALDAFQRFRGTGDKKALATHPVDAFERQCRNGQQLLENLKEVSVHSKVQVAADDFFRYYDLAGIGGRIVVTPDELRTSLDRKRDTRSLIHLPEKPGPIYFSSYGRDGRTGKDIYRTELLPTGQFAEPVRLAGFINTDEDEDYPFMAPDGRTFYFCSKGHNSMGGYDVFRSTYDKGMDVFGPPENMDFAVNTPDDDIFYIVDASGQEACFASARDSRQDMVHVYRISTQQVPVTITVLKGTFASDFDPADRKAHIVVEDGLTREVMADVRTDMNGTYLISLPRSGRYRFLVEAGPSGRTHAGIVEVPRSDVPHAYRQELQLVQQDGQERLVIKNYFDRPLDDDLIALSLDEIKRRAKLDVNDGQTSMPQEVAANSDAATGDLMVQAGFNADLTPADAMRMARDGAATRTSETAELKARASNAYALALENADQAEQASREAGRAVDEAAATPDGPVKNERMLQAAEARQRSRDANLRARAALEVGQDLEAEQLAVARSAAEFEKVAEDLGAAMQAGDRQRVLTALVRLKQEQSTLTGPGATPGVDERIRRSATAKREEAARALTAANAKRQEEIELNDRIVRLRNELSSTRANGRRDELQRQIDTYTEQLGYVKEEGDAAFNKAGLMEQNARVGTAKADLMSGSITAGTKTEVALDENAIATLGRRIADNEDRIGSIAIDQRFVAQLAEAQNGVTRDSFDWELAENRLAEDADRTSTRATMDNATDAGQEDLLQSHVLHDPDGASPNEVAEREGTRVQDRTENDAAATKTNTTVQGDAGDGDRSQAEIGSENSELADVAPTGLTPEQVREGQREEGATQDTELNVDPVGRAEHDRFLLENELAELEQVREATRARSVRDSLDLRIAAKRQELASAEDALAEARGRQDRTQQSAAGGSPAGQQGPGPAARTFDAHANEEAIIAELYPGFAQDESRAQEMTDQDERISDLIGLNAMLLDSIHAESDRQLALLETTPDQANVILPRVQRLRDMGRAREERIADYRDQAARGVQDLASAADAVGVPASTTMPEDQDGSTTERYVAMPSDPLSIYDAELQVRSPKVGEAVATWTRDLGRVETMDREIDSLEAVLDTMIRGREFDKLRKRTDRMIDDRLILTMEMGQRSEFITREETKVMRDSLRTITALVDRKGLSPTEPLLAMADRNAADAQRTLDTGARLRKAADRTEDIIARDSLFRTAYTHELEGLRQLDRAITIRNYILSDDFQRGQRPTYAEMEARLFPEGPSATDLADAGIPAPGTVTRIAEGEEAGTVSLPRDGREGLKVQDAAVPTTVRTDSVASGRSRETADTRKSGEAGMARTTIGTDATDKSLAGNTGKAEGQRTGEALQHAAEDAMSRSKQQERRSLELNDRAVALRDSSTTVRARDREEVGNMALRAAALSDSLHAASVESAEEAMALEQEARDAAQKERLAEDLRKYYYLSDEDYRLVLDHTDHSQYFGAKVKALDQQRAAQEAEEAADSNRGLGRDLVQQAQRIMTLPPGATGPVTQEDLQRARALNDQAVVLDHRADSLSAVAQRLRSAATLNDGQAALMLQAVAADSASAIMAMEQRARREEPMLAEVRASNRIPAVQKRDAVEGAVRSEPPSHAAQDRNGGTVAQRSTELPGTDQGIRAGTNERSRPAEARGGVDHQPFDFPMPEELREDIFSLVPTARREEPIPIDAPMPKGLVYKVQIGAFRNPIPKELFNDMSPVMGESTDNGLVRYSAGLFTTFDAADQAKARVRERGYRDAFVVVYLDGKRIALRDARDLLAAESGAQEENGPTVQAPTERGPERTEVPPTPAPITVPSGIVPPAAVVSTADAETLSKYPDSADRVLAAFTPPTDATSYYNDPTAAPAKQVEVVRGLFFTVQVGVYSRPVPLDKLFNITPLNTERIDGGKIRYTTGIYRDLDRVRARKDETVVSGVQDAFITAYLNGKRIPMTDARALLTRFGAQVLVDPEQVTP
ncbi:MAG: PD40 domain-containing protein [Flavobacteriales bacterium]|nr:PD40 domain-containing protein [Flavobacteriales bacterium]